MSDCGVDLRPGERFALDIAEACDRRAARFGDKLLKVVQSREIDSVDQNAAEKDDEHWRKNGELDGCDAASIACERLQYPKLLHGGLRSELTKRARMAAKSGINDNARAGCGRINAF